MACAGRMRWQRVLGSGIVAEVERIVNRIKSKVRSRVEHVFAVVKSSGSLPLPRCATGV